MPDFVCTYRFCEKIRSIMINVELVKNNLNILDLLTHVVPMHFNQSFPSAKCWINRQRYGSRVIDTNFHFKNVVPRIQRFFNDVAKRSCFYSCLTRCYVLCFSRAEWNDTFDRDNIDTTQIEQVNTTPAILRRVSGSLPQSLSLNPLMTIWLVRPYWRWSVIPLFKLFAIYRYTCFTASNIFVARLLHEPTEPTDCERYYVVT